jgi:hypothetical protein
LTTVLCTDEKAEEEEAEEEEAEEEEAEEEDEEDGEDEDEDKGKGTDGTPISPDATSGAKPELSPLEAPLDAPLEASTGLTGLLPSNVITRWFNSCTVWTSNATNSSWFTRTLSSRYLLW